MHGRRSLAVPHRAIRAARVQGAHATVGALALLLVVGAALTWHSLVWNWQMDTCSQFLSRFGIAIAPSGIGYDWDQTFVSATLSDLALSTVMIVLVTYVLFRSTVVPSLKGLFAITAVPLYLYVLVTYWTGKPPTGALNHVGPEWLVGEVVVWCLVAGLYATLVFPVPFSLPVKLLSLASVLAISVAWRTFTPALYILIAFYTNGMMALPAWMVLGPWADYLYIIPVFAVTLSFYKGGKASDYRM